MTWSSETNTLQLYVSGPTARLFEKSPKSTSSRGSPGHFCCHMSVSAWCSARVADQLDTVAVPPEPHHAVEALDAAGVYQCDGVAGRGVGDAVEPVGVRHAGGDELAEVEQHGAGVRVVGVGVGLDDHRRQLRAFVVVACQRFGVPCLIAARVAG